MARPLRIEYPGAGYHVTSRGNARQPIFRDDRDRQRLVDVLVSVVERAKLLCHAYCLMENHLSETARATGLHYSTISRIVNGKYGTIQDLTLVA
jgi:hypothetical protein